MTHNKTLFDNTAIENDPLNEVDNILENTDPKDLIDTLVGEGKKYPSVSELAKGAIFKDAHIKKIEKENAELRQKITSDASIKDLIEALSNKSDSDTSNKDTNTTSEPKEEVKNVVNPDDIVNKVLEQINTQRMRETAEANLNLVKTKLQEAFGPSYQNKLMELVTDLDLPQETVDNLAKTRPQSLLKLLRVDGTSSNSKDSLYSAPPRTVENTVGKYNGKAEVRNEKYWEDFYKRDPLKYNSEEMRKLRMADALKLGENYFLTSNK